MSTSIQQKKISARDVILIPVERFAHKNHKGATEGSFTCLKDGIAEILPSRSNEPLIQILFFFVALLNIYWVQASHTAHP